jgi:hypothetical protein
MQVPFYKVFVTFHVSMRYLNLFILVEWRKILTFAPIKKNTSIFKEEKE